MWVSSLKLWPHTSVCILDIFTGFTALFRNIKIGSVFFIDDNKENRDVIQTLSYAITFDAEQLNKSAIEKEIAEQIKRRFN